MSSKVIVHIDLNAFFVRCEEIKEPSLEGKPVAIGHEGRCGIVSTCSYAARKFGVHSGMPMFKAKLLCPKLIIINEDFRFYRMMSRRFFNFVKRYTSLVEPMSIDECFLDFTEQLKSVKDPYLYFRKLQDDLYKETSLKCSIGVSVTKFLAKMASDMQKPMGLTIIHKRDIGKMIYPLPIEDMFGVGKKSVPRLKSLGMKTIGDLYKQLCKEDDTIFGKRHDVLKDWLEGKGSDEIETERRDPKSLGNSTTFPFDTDEPAEVKKYFLILSKEVSMRAKKERKLAKTIQIVVKDTSFKSFNKSISLDKPTDNAKIIYEKAITLYDRYFRQMNLRLVGITLQNLIDADENGLEITLFDEETPEERNVTKLLIEEINRSFKGPLLKRASDLEK